MSSERHLRAATEKPHNEQLITCSQTSNQPQQEGQSHESETVKEGAYSADAADDEDGNRRAEEDVQKRSCR